MRAAAPLGAYDTRVTDRLDRWALEAPERPFLAERDLADAWTTIAYGEMRRRARRVARALQARSLGPERPLAILSGNSIAHAVLMFGAMYAGVPVAPLAPAYALQSRDHATLARLLALLTPGMLFASDPTAFAGAIASAAPGDCEVVLALDALEDAAPTGAPLEGVGPDTVAKILFTSGSTGAPKGVLTTHRMLCANQAQLAHLLPELGEAPPVLCDWLPWHHTFGGSHNLGLVLHHGGTLHINGGTPTAAGIARTVANLRDVSPTAYFDVPRGFELLVPHLREDARLRESFFARTRFLFTAAAGMSQAVVDALQALAVEVRGDRVPIVTGFGATEAAPFALGGAADDDVAGGVGLPALGVELKLAPSDDERREGRVRGPNVTPGYWRDPARTASAFDDEGYLRLGDALAWVDESAPGRGLRFDGRLDDDFKLAAGSWVRAAPLRARLLAALGTGARDAVIVGADRAVVAALVFVDPDRAPGRVRVRAALHAVAARATGTSSRLARVLLLSDAPSVDAGEVTAKGTLSARAVVRHRAGAVEELYAERPSARTVTLDD